MMLVLALAWILFDPRILLALATVQSMRPAEPSTIWPTSVAGWFGVIVSAVLITEKLITAWKGGQRPILMKIEEVKTDVFAEVKRIESEVHRELEQFHEEENEHRIAFRESVTAEVNGVGRRATDAEMEANRANEANIKLAERMLRTEIDREVLRKEVNDAKQEIIRTREAIERENRQTRKATRIAREQLLGAIRTLSSKEPHR